MNNKYTVYLTVILLVFANLLFAANDTLINSNASWKYLDNGSNQGNAWFGTSFNDAGWATGNAQLGYGDGDEATVVSYGPAANNRYITTYFRKTFTVANPNDYTGLKINLLRDDGAVVYLNGVEVVRSNMPAGAITYTTLAVNGIENTGESTYNTFTILPESLSSGNNTIAVEIHQKAVTSNDISFDLRLIASQTCDVPSGFSVSGITTGKATVNWNAVAVAQNYSVQYRVSGATTWKTKTATTNSYTITSLLAGTTYEYRVKTNCSLGGSAYSSIQTFTTLVVCNAPSTQSATGITSSSATLNWSAFANALTYKIKYRKTGIGVWTTINTGLTSVNISGLQAGTSYEWTVQSLCSNNSSVVSAPVNFTTLPACDIPSNLNVNNLTPLSCTLSCDAVLNALSYDFQYRPTTVFTWTTINSASPSLNISGMLPNSDYVFHVRSNCALGFTSAYSSDNIFSTPDVCGVPANLQNLTTTLTTGDATWDAVPGAFDYDIEYRKIGTLTWVSFNTSNTSYLFTSLIPNSDYACRVRANCPWNSNYSSENIFSTSSQCDVASALSVSNITTTSVQLNWSANTYAASYDVEYRIVGSGTWNSVNTLTNSVTVNALSSATSYEWQVRVNCNYNSSSSFVQGNNFTTLTPLCNEATGFSVSNITTNSSTLNWSTVANASSYDVRYRIIGNPTWTSLNVTSNSLIASSLTPASIYEWQVRTNCIWGNSSSYAVGNNFTTLTPPCNNPSNHAVSSVTENSATLSWNSVANASDYTVQYRIVGNPTWTTVMAVSNSMTISLLSVASEYEWQVRTNCIYSNNSSFVGGNNFTTLTPICFEPANLSTSNITDVSATFSWNAVPNATSYDLQYRLVGNPTWTDINTALTTVTVNTLSANSNYEWQLKANCIFGNSSNYVTGFSFLTLPPPCANPSGHSASNITINSADLSWNNNANAFNYDVRYRIVGNPTWINVSNPTNSMSIFSLSPASVYEWQVRTNCLLGNSSSYVAGSNFTTLTPPCNGPTGLSVSNITTTTASLSWSTVTDAANYTVQYRIVGNPTWTSTTVSGISTTVSSLSVASIYEWQVRTNCIYSNTSSYTSGVNFTTLTPPCNNPTNLNVTNIFAIAASFSWSSVTYAGSYDFQYRDTGNPNWTTVNTASTSVSLNTLLPSTTYEWQVKTNCIYSNSSGYTTGSNFSTPAIPACNDYPANLAVGTVTASTSAITWSAVSGVYQYNLRYRNIGNANWTATTATTTSKTLSLLNASTTYEVQIQTDCGGSVSPYSASVSFTTNSNSAADSLITAYSSWKYLDNGSNQGTAWISPGFDDSGWASGNAELGYGDGDENTIVSYGPNASDKYTTTYFRKTFSVVNPATYASMALNIVRDDGAVVYINGTEVMRSNMPTGTITSATLASTGISGSGETTFQTATVATTTLLSGSNTIAVEIHQNDSTSSDISFNLKLAGTKSSIASLSRGPYLQMVTPTSFRVRWRTSIATNSRVRYGTTMSYGSEVNDGTSSTEHDILVSGLTPNTVYYYTVGSSGQDMQGDVNNYCKTSLPTASTEPFRVWATGDFGIVTTGQTNTRNAMETYTAGKRPNFWIWMGDNAYNSGTDTEYSNNVFAIYPSQFKNIPVYPSLGNHDYANSGYKSGASLGTGFPYFSMFSCPTAAEAGGFASGTEKYYSYNYGNAHFVVIDSYGSLNAAGTAQYTWLQNDLAANTQRWTVAYFHHPPYTMGTHNSDSETELIDMRNNIAPLLEQYKVDLVLSGHSHNYERTWLIKGHTGLENTFNNSHKVDTTNGLSPYYLKTAGSNFDGTVYCVCGNSGQGGSVSTAGSWPHAAMRQYSKTLWGSMIIDFSADTLDAKFLTSTGTIYDQFKIVKSGTARFISPVTLKTKNKLSVFPNPFSNELNLHFSISESSSVAIEVFDLSGKTIYTTEKKYTSFLEAGEYEMILTNAELGNVSGMLMIRLTTNNDVFNSMVERLK